MKPIRKIKKPDASSQLILEEIIGLTAKNCNGLASSASTGKCAYLAGCVVVVNDVDTSSQSHLMVSHRMPKPLCCVAMSHDSRFVAAGESGAQPAVIVWDCANLTFISELKDHLYGVECIAFSPDGEHLVSVGGYIYLWNWRTATLVTKLKANSSPSAITSASFSSDAKLIVTAGKKHLKFWTVGSSVRTRLNRDSESLTLHAKPVNLGIQKGSSFVSVISASETDNGFINRERAGRSFTIYALTDAGVLYIIHSRLSVTKSVDLKVEKGFAISASNKYIACACSYGAVHLFTIQTLKYAGTLHYSKAKEFNVENDIVYNTNAAGLDCKIAAPLPDAVACQFSTLDKLVVVYADHSLHIWDIGDVNEATRCCVVVSHSASIWDVKNLCCKNMHNPSVACVARGCSGGVSFSTCSADGTIRLWDLGLQPEFSKDVSYVGAPNIELRSTAHLVSAGIFERDTMETSVRTQGFRSMAVSSDGKYLAAGDFEGNLHIFDLESSDYTCFKDAHGAEILSLGFSLSTKEGDFSEEVKDSHYFLASGGRDRTIHLYDVKRNFDLVQSIDDHSAAVTSVKFTSNGCKLLSCSADRSLVFRDISETASGVRISRRHQQLASHGTVYDMDIDPKMEVVITVGQDKKINTFNIAGGKLSRSFKQGNEFGDPIKVSMDPSGCYLVCSYSNKLMCLYDFISGEMVAQATGHGEVITGVTFLPDCKHLVSVGGDGCIFLWKVPSQMTYRMLHRVKENYGMLSSNLDQPVALNQLIFCEGDQRYRMDPSETLFVKDVNFGSELHYHDGKPQVTSAFRFSISRLPKWAQEKVAGSDVVSRNLDFYSSPRSAGQRELGKADFALRVKDSVKVAWISEATLPQEEPKILTPLIGNGTSYTSECQEVQTPCHHDLEASNTSLSCYSRSSGAYRSQSSLMPQEQASGFALSKRWLTVYTVCMDRWNSPEEQSLKDAKMPLSSPSMTQDQQKVLNNGECSSSHGDNPQVDRENPHASPHRSGFVDKKKHQFNRNILSSCTEYDAHVAEQLQMKESNIQENKDVSTSLLKFEDSDLFKQHFGSLSEKNMVKDRKSTVRKRFSAQYVVRRDYGDGPKGLFATPVRNFGQKTSNSVKKYASCGTSRNHISPLRDSSKQLTESLLSSNHAPCRDETNKCTINKSSEDIDLEEATFPRRNKVLERVTECKEALVNLDAAAEIAIQLFSKLGTELPQEKISAGPEAQLYDEAAELLPSIIEKLNAIARQVQHRNNDGLFSGDT